MTVKAFGGRSAICFFCFNDWTGASVSRFFVGRVFKYANSVEGPKTFVFADGTDDQCWPLSVLLLEWEEPMSSWT